eukprot:4835848-Alexandrium_andersonii.AAC.1
MRSARKPTASRRPWSKSPGKRGPAASEGGGAPRCRKAASIRDARSEIPSACRPCCSARANSK